MDLSPFVTCVGIKIDNHCTEGNIVYPYDSRWYILFISMTDIICQHYNIENVDDWKALHRDCMLRLLLWFGVHFQCMDEIYTSPLSDDNNTAHLSLDNFALLFGGHQAMNATEEPIHQMPHQDFSKATNVSGEVVSISENQLFNNLQCPGSFIIPLSKERQLKIAGSGIVTVNRGEILFFGGDVTHCGVTTRAGMDPFTWNACFHCLLCSRHHPSTLDIFDVDIHEIRKSQPELLHLLDDESQEEVITTMLSEMTLALRGCRNHQSDDKNVQLLSTPSISAKFAELTALHEEMFSGTATIPLNQKRGCGCLGPCGKKCGCKKKKLTCHSGCKCNGNC